MVSKEKKVVKLYLCQKKKDIKIRQRSSLNKGSFHQEHNNCKYLHPQHQSTQVYKAKNTEVKGEINSNIIVGDFNTFSQ